MLMAPFCSYYCTLSLRYAANMRHLISISSKFVSNISVREDRCCAALHLKKWQEFKMLMNLRKTRYLVFFGIADFKLSNRMRTMSSSTWRLTRADIIRNMRVFSITNFVHWFLRSVNVWRGLNPVVEICNGTCCLIF